MTPVSQIVLVFLFPSQGIMFSMIFVYPWRKSYQLSNNFIIDSIVASDIPSDNSISVNNTITTMQKELYHGARAKLLGTDV